MESKRPREHAALNELFADVEDLRAARELLGKVWHELGPYGSNVKPLSTALVIELQRYFGFDDSE